jgi:hypothetical protein
MQESSQNVSILENDSSYDNYCEILQYDIYFSKPVEKKIDLQTGLKRISAA